MSTLNTLITSLQRSAVLVTPSIIKAFEHVDRMDFVKNEHKSSAYQDRPLPIGYGQTISQPTTVAFMLERLEVEKDEEVLDVGSGSGWTTALLAYLVTPSGSVVGVERIPELVKFGQVNLSKYDYEHARIEQAGDKLGWEKDAPYDKILVSAAAQEIPQELIDQLKVGGSMVLPVKSSIYKITKTSDKKHEIQKFYGFSFVPLVQDRIEPDEGTENISLI